MKRKKQLDEQGLREKLLLLLGRREYSKSELFYKLKSQVESEQLLSKTLVEFEQAGYQSDLRYAEMIFRHRVEQLHGPQKIRYELKQKGIPTEIEEQCFGENQPDWLENARKLFEKRRQSERLTLQEKAKQSQYLLNQGYSFDTIQKVLKYDPSVE